MPDCESQRSRLSVDILERARAAAGLSRAELARRAGTSRPTLAAYASGRKSPNLATAERIANAAGFDLELVPHQQFHEVMVSNGRRAYVPAALPRLSLDCAFARVSLPLHLNWSSPHREFNLAHRSDRARVYEVVLREGTANDITCYVDGALLVDIWPDLVLPAPVKKAWQPLVDAARHVSEA